MLSRQLSPDLLDWWLALRQLPEQLGAVHRWTASEHPPSKQTPGHLHATATLVACLRGTVRISDGDRRTDLMPGDALVLAAGAWHYHDPLRGNAVLFLQGFMRGQSDFWLCDRHERFFATVPKQPSSQLMEAIAEAADPRQRQRLLGALLENFTKETIRPLQDLRPEVARMEQAVWRLMRQPGTAEDVIRAAGISRAQAYRLFVDHYGMPPAKALLEQRMEYARHLLRAGITVTETAERSGFPSRQTFTRAFTREQGCSPQAWQQYNQGL